MADVESSSTIVGLSTAPGKAGVAVIRVSGPAASEVCRQIAGDVPAPRQAVLRTFHAQNGQPIDRGLVLFFPAPASFTGEDLAEFQCHGSRAVVDALMGAVLDIPGVVAAERGEFTRRAFAAGKMDLVQVEALADLIDSETEQQRRYALAQLEHGLGARARECRTQLVALRAHAEAIVDFSDEGDVPDMLPVEIENDLAALRDEIEARLEAATQSIRIRSGFSIVIVGAPNVGKSSLLNAIAGEDVAIVTDTPGTTRDVISVAVDLKGYKVTISDTAGLRETPDDIEALGIERAVRKLEDATLILWLYADDGPGQKPDAPFGIPIWAVRNKIDIGPDDARAPAGVPAFAISAKTGQGIATLLDAIGAYIAEHAPDADDIGVSRARHKGHLAECAGHLTHALGDRKERRVEDNAAILPVESGAGLPYDLRLEELRLAAQALGRLTGDVDVEELLDVIFQDFCVGK